MKTSTLLLLGILAIAVVGAAAFAFSQLKDASQNGSSDPITSFTECAEQYPVIDTYPQECQTDEGLQFIQMLPETEREQLSEPITTYGRVVCLPHWNTTGPQTMECAFGLQDTFGNYYTLRSSDDASIGQAPTDGLVTVIGEVTPGSHEQYQSIGTIEVASSINWNTSTNTSEGASFSYPETLVAGTYVEAVDWPPTVQMSSESFACTEAGSEIDRAGATREIQINDNTYCVTVVEEGAAGSVYRQYSYALPYEGGTLTFTFSARFPQCDNYDEPQRSACADEQESFAPDNLMHAVAQSLE